MAAQLNIMDHSDETVSIGLKGLNDDKNVVSRHCLIYILFVCKYLTM